MGNRAIITLENTQGKQHPIALYVHWNGGLESVLAFMTYTWETFPRGRDDLHTFHARLCQVMGNFFPDGLSLYGHPLKDVRKVASGCDNGHFHFRIGPDGVSLPNRDAECTAARAHEYWHREEPILHTIHKAMPTKGKHYEPLGGSWNTHGEAVA